MTGRHHMPWNSLCSETAEMSWAPPHSHKIHYLGCQSTSSSSTSLPVLSVSGFMCDHFVKNKCHTCTSHGSFHALDFFFLMSNIFLINNFWLNYNFFLPQEVPNCKPSATHQNLILQQRIFLSVTGSPQPFPLGLCALQSPHPHIRLHDILTKKSLGAWNSFQSGQEWVSLDEQG